MLFLRSAKLVIFIVSLCRGLAFDKSMSTRLEREKGERKI